MSAIAALEQDLKAEYARTDPNLTMNLVAENGDFKATSAGTTRRALDTVFAYPHGVEAMSKDIAGLVETSNNMATIGSAIKIKGGVIDKIWKPKPSVGGVTAVETVKST